MSFQTDLAKFQPKLFKAGFTCEHLNTSYCWKVTEVEYELIRYFCQEEEEKLKRRSTFLFSSPRMIERMGNWSEDVNCIVEDIRKKISQLYYVEMIQIVSDEIYLYSDLKGFCTLNCLVCQFPSVPNRGIFLFSPQQEELNSVYETLCKEFLRRKGKSSVNVDNDNHRSSLYGGKMVSSHYPSSAPKTPNNKESNEVLTIGSMRVKIYQASILDAKVDAIVNAANTNLTHEAGVSRIIRQAAGQEYVEECGWLLRKNGPSLQTAKCYRSNPGRLKSKFTYILHAVGPRWSEYREKEDCINRLAATMKNILETAETLGIGSVAMPAIGSGKIDP